MATSLKLSIATFLYYFNIKNSENFLSHQITLNWSLVYVYLYTHNLTDTDSILNFWSLISNQALEKIIRLF